jgi:hypothetical protein
LNTIAYAVGVNTLSMHVRRQDVPRYRQPEPSTHRQLGARARSAIGESPLAVRDPSIGAGGADGVGVVIVLTQASMAPAAAMVDVAATGLSSPRAAVAQLLSELTAAPDP